MFSTRHWEAFLALCSTVILFTGGNSASAQRGKEVLLAEAKLWDLETGNIMAELGGLSRKARCVGFSPGENKLVLGGDHKLLVFDRKGRRLSEQEDKERLLHCLAFSPTEDKVAVGYMCGKLAVHDLKRGKCDNYYLDETNSWEMWTVTFSSDGKTLVVGGGTRSDEPGKVKFLDAATGKQLSELDHPEGVAEVAVSADGKWLAVGSGGLAVKLYDWETKKEKFAVHGYVPFLFSANSKLLLTTYQEQIWLWDLETGKEKLSIRIPAHTARSVALSPDGKILATGGALTEPAIKLWDTTTGKLIRALEGSSPGVIIQALAFSPDGKTLASAGYAVRYEKKGAAQALPGADMNGDFPKGEESARSDQSDSLFQLVALIAAACGVVALGTFLWCRRGRRPPFLPRREAR